MDFGIGADLDNITERTLAASNGGTTVGVDVTGQVITFHLGSNAGQGIAADQYVQIKIGRNTGNGPSPDVTGELQIINPTVPGLYQISAQTKSATTLTFSDGLNEEIVWDPDGLNKFAFAAGTNEDICFDVEGDGLDAAGCATDDDVLVNLITDGGLVADTSYTGAQVATAIKTGLEVQNGSTDTYTVTYSTSTHKFTIQPLSGTTDVGIVWTEPTSTASRILGFTADDVSLYTTGIWTSDIRAGTAIIDIIDDAVGINADTAYSGAAVATALDGIFEDTGTFPRDSGDDHDYTVSFSGGIFTIAEDTITDGSEPIFYWTWAESTAAYTLGFTSDVSGLADGFSFDSDISSTTKQIDTATTAIYIVDNDQITLSAGVDPNLEMEINGGLAYAYVEGDRDTLGVDFGALEPNAFYKLGGAKTEFGKIEVNLTCTIAAVPNQACIPETDDTVTIRGVTYTFKRVAADAARQDDFVYASITGTTQEQRAAKLLTNLYRAINSTDDNVRANISRDSDTILYVLSTREGSDATFALSQNTNSGANNYLTLTTYADSDGSGVNSYFYVDNQVYYNPDPTSYQTDLSGVSDFRGHNIKINTNAADGYTLQIRDEGPDVVSPFRPWATGTNIGFGLYAYSQSTRWGNNGNTAEGDDLVAEPFQGGESMNVNPRALSTDYQTLARNDVSTARDNISLEYVIRIDANQLAGNYQNTLDLMLSAQF